MTKTTESIRRLNNGAIDTAYYVNKGHVIRSRAAHRSLNRIKYEAASDIRSIKGLFSKLTQYFSFRNVVARKVVQI